MNFYTALGITKAKGYYPLQDPDERYEPIHGDEIDELVNWQLEQGKEQRQ